MTFTFRIAPLIHTPENVAALSEILTETVANGGSVSFMHPLPFEEAQGFWNDSLARTKSGGRVVLGAWLGEELIGTLTLDMATPPNQPHRADLAKMMVRVKHRGQGVATSLVKEAERIAVERHRTLLVLDTADHEGASGLYERLGYQRVGVIPGYAMTPHGKFCGTIIYYKPIGPLLEG